jgi:hypothetical protein
MSAVVIGGEIVQQALRGFKEALKKLYSY